MECLDFLVMYLQRIDVSRLRTQIFNSKVDGNVERKPLRTRRSNGDIVKKSQVSIKNKYR